MNRFGLARACALAFVLAACDGPAALLEPEDVTSRLKRGDTSVCTDPDVQSTFLAVVAGEEAYRTFAAEGEQNLPMSAVSASGVDKEIGEVRCSGNVEVPAFALRPLASVERVEWAVRPSLDEGGSFIVETQQGYEAISGYIAWENLGRRSNEDSPDPVQSEPEPPSEPDPDNATMGPDGPLIQSDATGPYMNADIEPPAENLDSH